MTQKEFKFKDILNLHIKYIDYLLEKSYLSHQSVKNINLSGSEIENEIRFLFKSILPERFKITHGYILSAEDNKSEPIISNQVDMIIVDTLVPHKIFTLDKENGMEIVPVESVVGIFEIKRTLDKKALKSALNQLSKITKRVGIKKDDETHYLSGGLKCNGLISGIYSNPILGILSLDYDLPRREDTITLITEKKLGLDLVASLNGLLIAPCNDPKEKSVVNFKIENVRKEEGYYMFLDKKTVNQIGVFSRIFGIVLAYLTNCSGRRIDVGSYFFNKKTWELLKISPK